MRVMFAGSPSVALPALKAVRESRHDLVGVLTRPPKATGRKRVLTPTSVHAQATEWGLPVATPANGAEILAAVESWRPDVAVVVAYGQLLSDDTISAVPHGWWNVHFSLLPRWRGAAPVQQALLAGDEVTGVTIFRIQEGLDTGDIATSTELSLGGVETAGEVLDALSQLAIEPLLETLERIEDESVVLSPQSGEVTYAGKPGADFGRLEWAQPARELSRRVRAATPEPGAYTTRSDTGQRVLVTACGVSSEPLHLEPGELHPGGAGVLVGTGRGVLELITVHPSGKRPMPAADWYRGLPGGVRLRG